jgi:hypothetical protein
MGTEGQIETQGSHEEDDLLCDYSLGMCCAYMMGTPRSKSKMERIGNSRISRWLCFYDSQSVRCMLDASDWMRPRL